MKYVSGLSCDPNSSHQKILSYVRPGSVVLELGCASGRMTCYLTQQLNCRVSIVEKEFEAFEIAKKYAYDGICADILNDEWITHYADEQFDFIILADVLEHTGNPLSILSSIKPLLKKSGEILISVPNVAHSDILFSLLKNSFEYSEEGLLDNSHVYWFTYYSMHNMVLEAGYFVEEEDAVLVEPFHTELKLDREKFDTTLINLVNLREFFDVYQFVFKICHKDYAIQNSLTLRSKIQKTISGFLGAWYLDRGRGFNKEDCFTLKSLRATNKNSFHLKIDPGVKTVRFDPIEIGSCLLKDLQITIDNQTILPKIQSGIQLGNYTFINGDDPQLYFEVEDNHIAHTINLSAEFHFINDFVLRSFIETFCDNYSRILSENESNKYLIKDTLNKKAALAELNNNITNKCEQLLNQLQFEKDKQEQMLKSMKAESERNSILQTEFDDLKNKLQCLDNEFVSLKRTYQNVVESLSWKLTKPFRRLRDTIKK